MSEHYAKAPITEAIIDIRTTEAAAGKANFAEMQTARVAEYPVRNEMIATRAHLEVSGAGAKSTVAPPRFFGYSFNSSDEKRSFQARPNGFTFSRLAPYQSWEPFRDEAKSLWGEFRSRFQPASIQRLAVRYVNRIDIPTAARIELQDYLRIAPELPDDMRQGVLSAFFMQLTIPQPDSQAIAVISEAAVPPARQDCESFLLDIDLFRESAVPQEEGEIWNYFERLRSLKNEIFEASITEELRKLIR